MKWFLTTIAFVTCWITSTAQIRPGSERTDEYTGLLNGKSVAIVANQTSLIGNTHLVDSLLALGIKIKCVFAPEHGFRGNFGAGAVVADEKDIKTGLQVISLYGKNKKPTSSQLKGVDYMVFDIQDVGARFYTYISTLHYVMEACAENGIPLIVLDRPNPNDNYIDGPVLDTSLRTFVGMHPVPVVYGMTIGEYAKMINGEGWLKGGITCRLNVIEIANYKHGSNYILPVKPSPNLPCKRSVELYPTLCLFEGTPLSVGRGTDMPFTIVGHPLLKGKTGVNFYFIPDIGSVCGGDTCYGFDLTKQNDHEVINELDLKLIQDIYNLFPDKSEFFSKNLFFDKLAGTTELRKQIIEGKSPEEIRSSWKKGLDDFRKKREKYLLYD